MSFRRIRMDAVNDSQNVTRLLLYASRLETHTGFRVSRDNCRLQWQRWWQDRIRKARIQVGTVATMVRRFDQSGKSTVSAQFRAMP